jgi:hypothetical protein
VDKNCNSLKIPPNPTGGARGCDVSKVCAGVEFAIRVVGASVAAAANGTITIRPKWNVFLTGLYLSDSAANYTSACTTVSWVHTDDDMYKNAGAASQLENDIVDTMDLIDFEREALGSTNTINLLEPQYRWAGPNNAIVITWTNGTGGPIIPKLVVLARHPRPDEIG